VVAVTRTSLIALGVAACLRQPSPEGQPDAPGTHPDGARADARPDAFVPPDAAQPPNYMFVTSIVGTANTLAEADAFCATRAGSATGVDLGSGHYVAWLSDSTTNAIDRLQGARGWIRPDGLPFADTAADIAAGNLFYPPRIDELQQDQGMTSMTAATGTQADGTQDPGECFGCPSMALGAIDGGAVAWTDNSSVTSSSTFNYYCFQIDHLAVVAPVDTHTNRVFLSSEAVGGNATLSVLDQTCQHDDGSAVAFVATSTAAATARLMAGHGPWIRPDNVVAISSDTKQLLAPIEVTPAGTHVPAQVWGGSLNMTATGSTGSTCNNWTSGSGSGITGLANRSTNVDSFSSGLNLSCTGSAHLYCVEP
jgi:hypothetical protein